ncbi:hypothetical protein C2S53_008311 [Perilla frutescens var. hirtella]|uniref:F-box associated beta-propeller type 3 domain-containing protein n=1 Tax=Perilla frutescens var. hirtella TaxID=608512 RepID=A0AAD4P9K5_PERFH|nr:hypothetical protein C2S53_008311 [Perilla frutescens var. hirtella]
MAFMSKNLLKSISKLRHVSDTFSLYIPKHHHIFETAVAEDKCSSKHRVLVRSFRNTVLDESRYFSDLSIKNLIPISKLVSRISDDMLPFSDRCFCGSASYHVSALSCENFSPIHNPNFPSFDLYKFLGSYGGVVCFDNKWEDAVFWNPLTNETKLLPSSDLDRPDPTAEPKRIVKALSLSSGFGFDSCSEDYKYIRWVTFLSREEEECIDNAYTVVELYSLKTDSWKLIPNPSGRGVRLFSACVNGDFYWSTDWIGPAEIMKFDFGVESFSYLPFPHTGKKSFLFNLFDFRGSLGVVVYPKMDEEEVHVKSCGGVKSLMIVSRVVRSRWGFRKTEVDIYIHPHEPTLIPYDEATVSLRSSPEDDRPNVNLSDHH